LMQKRLRKPFFQLYDEMKGMRRNKR